MVNNIQHGILETGSYPNNRKSSIIFNNEFVLTSAAILQPFLEKNSLFTDMEIEDIKYMLRCNEFIKSPKKIVDSLERIHFNVIFDQLQIGMKSKFLVKHKTRVLYVFKSDPIYKSISPIIDKLCNQTITKRSNGSWEMVKLISSTFIILQITESDQRFKNQDILQIMQTYLKVLEPTKKLEEVLTISCPFGLEIFYKTINFGRVSNVLGGNNSVFLISNSLTEDCEGSAVFNSKMKLIGIVIYTAIPLSGVLVAGVQHIFSDLLYKLGKLKNPSHLIWKSSSSLWEKSVVLVQNSHAQGSGVFTKILGKKFILTCSHVVHELQKTNCIYADGATECNIVWSNPIFDIPYDIALLEAPPTLPNSCFARISNERPKIGQLVYSAGFPYFYTNLDNQTPNSCISEGRVVKYVPGFLVADAYVDAGHSGGPLFNENGEIVGICICNVKGENNLYPTFNMSVPLWDIKTILEEYVKTKERKILNKLVASASVQGLWKLKSPEVRSQL